MLVGRLARPRSGAVAVSWAWWAPVSHVASPLSGGGERRWSVVCGQLVESMATLRGPRAMVWVGPPLLARVPRLREAVLTSGTLQVLSSARLPPLSVIVPAQLGMAEPATPATM